jgi:hypothetical protein
MDQTPPVVFSLGQVQETCNLFFDRRKNFPRRKLLATNMLCAEKYFYGAS